MLDVSPEMISLQGLTQIRWVLVLEQPVIPLGPCNKIRCTENTNKRSYSQDIMTMQPL